MSKAANYEFNMDAAYREIMSREAEGEDMSLAYVDPKTYAIKFKNPVVAAAGKALEAAHPWGYRSSDREP